MKQREIKFRIYSKQYGMQYPSKYLLSAFDFGVGTEHYIDDSTISYPIIDKDNFLMQFTGLHDKNGVEIYEGDIVNYDSGNIPSHQIIYSVDGFKMKRLTSNQLLPLRNSYKNIEVIGNIYSTPELLTPKN